MRHLAPIPCGTALFSLVMLSCTPAFTNRNNEPAIPVAYWDLGRCIMERDWEVAGRIQRKTVPTHSGPL